MKAPLLFEDDASEHERFIRQLQAEQAFSVTPNAGQTWEIKVGEDDGKPVYKTVKIIALANTEPNSAMEPVVVFRNSRKKISTWPLKEWIDSDTFLVSTN